MRGGGRGEERQGGGRRGREGGRRGREGGEERERKVLVYVGEIFIFTKVIFIFTKVIFIFTIFYTKQVSFKIMCMHVESKERRCIDKSTVAALDGTTNYNNINLKIMSAHWAFATCINWELPYQ